MVEIKDESITLIVNSEVVASARFTRHAAADAKAHRSSRAMPPGCSLATRRSRRWCSLNGAPLTAQISLLARRRVTAGEGPIGGRAAQATVGVR